MQMSMQMRPGPAGTVRLVGEEPCIYNKGVTCVCLCVCVYEVEADALEGFTGFRGDSKSGKVTLHQRKSSRACCGQHPF